MVCCWGLELPGPRFRFLVEVEAFPAGFGEGEDSAFGMELSFTGSRVGCEGNPSISIPKSVEAGDMARFGEQ